MDEQEYQRKYLNLKVLKSIQEYLKCEVDADTGVYPIKVPAELLYQLVKLEGAQHADEAIHRIFQLGLSLWSERLFEEVFGTTEKLESFIRMVKERRNK